jgi:hypothetical protein
MVYVAATMRAADRDEAALFALSPLDGLRASVEASTESYTVELDGTPAAIFGLAPAGGKGAPWLLATDAFPRGGMAVARRARWMVQRWSKMTPLENWCAPRNAIAIRFLEWLGFTIEPVDGRVLVRFSMARGTV